MTLILNILAATSAWLVFTCSAVTGASSTNATRACDGLASYQLTLKTLWSKTTFSNQYPAYRPSAQWSKLIGRSHSGRYSLWSEGKLSSVHFKEFAEQGVSTGLDTESQGSRSIFDAFIGPHITTGVGSSEVKFFVHSKYPKLSFVVRMIPSPDWFIGVDSVDLCTSQGHWKSDLTFDLHPMDAGTDRGFTFTSPNWPEKPPKPITTITSKSPDHPASSFYYPELDSLPPIARVQLTKVDIDWVETIATTEAKDQGVLLKKSTETEKTKRDVVIDRGESSAGQTVRHRSSSGKRQTRNGRTYVSRSKATSEIVTVSEGAPVDCEVSAWNDWSSCSKTCGYGQRVRSRSVIRRPGNGGHPCPLVQEEQLCGSMRNCGWAYFSRSNRTLSVVAQG